LPYDMEEENPTYDTTDNDMNSKDVLNERRYSLTTQRLLNHRLSRAVDSFIAKRAWNVIFILFCRESKFKMETIGLDLGLCSSRTQNSAAKL
jgi:hypothetical protein